MYLDDDGIFCKDKVEINEVMEALSKYFVVEDCLCSHKKYYAFVRSF
jgi:hypothetical protein